MTGRQTIAVPEDAERSAPAAGARRHPRLVLFTKVALGVLLSLGVLWGAVVAEETRLLWRTNTGFLAGYHVQRGPLPLPPGAAQSSGLAYAPERATLYVVVNAPPEIVELDTAGRWLRTVPLDGFADTEGIDYLGDNRFAVVDERRGILSRFRLEDGDKRVEFARAQHLQVVDPDKIVRNRGLEGVAHMPGTDRFFVIEERLPRRIFEVVWPVSAGRSSVTQPWDAEAEPWWGLRNLSDVYYDPRTGYLLILSRRSRAVVAYTRKGVEVARLHLTAGSAGLQGAIMKPEGLTMDENGNLYICAEPGQLYVFAPTKGSGSAARK